MNQSRRIFLKQSAATALLFGMESTGVVESAAGEKYSAKRRILAAPGPMIPPVPAILLTVNGNDTVADEISVVWTFVVNGKPPQIGISVGKEHVAGAFIKDHGEFVLNVPTANMVQAFDKVDMNSGATGDKFALSGLSRGRALMVDAPTVVESPIHVECRIFDEIAVPPVRTIFLADVLATTVLPGVCDKDGKLLVRNVPFFGMTAGSGEFYTMGTAIGHIGQSVGRDDIKY